MADALNTDNLSVLTVRFWNCKVHCEVGVAIYKIYSGYQLTFILYLALISRVDSAQSEYQSLSQENQMLQKYINNSLTSTAVFGATGGAIGNLSTTVSGVGEAPTVKPSANSNVSH